MRLRYSGQGGSGGGGGGGGGVEDNNNNNNNDKNYNPRRLFRAPGGIVMAWLYGIPTLIIGLVCAYFTDAHVWVWTLVFQACVLIVFAVKLLYQYHRRGVRLVGGGQQKK